MIKGKFGDSVCSKSYEGQVNGVLCRVIRLNLCVVIQCMFELGIEPDFCAKPLEPSTLSRTHPGSRSGCDGEYYLRLAVL